jgi:hypothetical protein
MTNQIIYGKFPCSTKNDLRIKEISSSIFDHLDNNDIGFNNLTRDILQTLDLYMQSIPDNEVQSLFLGSFLAAMKQYINRMKKNNISTQEIQNNIQAIQITMIKMLEEIKKDVITIH